MPDDLYLRNNKEYNQNVFKKSVKYNDNQFSIYLSQITSIFGMDMFHFLPSPILIKWFGNYFLLRLSFHSHWDIGVPVEFDFHLALKMSYSKDNFAYPKLKKKTG